MRWKWILGIAAFFVIAVIVAICAILSSYDFNYFKPQIARMVNDATGRELSLGGDLELKIGLAPVLVIEDVSFQNVQWGSRPELAKIRRLEVQVAVLPLIRRIIHVKRLILVEPDILIETNRAGKTNLEFKTVKKRKVAKTVEKATNQGKLILSALIFNKIRIENGCLTYKDGRSGKAYTVTLERATATAGTDSPVALNLKGEYNNKPFQVKAILGALTALTDPDKAWPVKLTSNIAGSTVTIDGAIRDPIQGKGLAITVTGKGRSIPEILKLFNITSVPELGPFDVTGKLTDLDGKLGVKDLDLKVGSEDMASARFTGTVEDLMTIKGMNFGFDIQGKDLANLEKITSKPMPFKGPFSVSGNAVVLSAKAFKISELKALIQESDLNGSLEINLAGEKPRITADLSSHKIDLRPLLSKKGGRAGESKKDSAKPPARKDKVFPDTPLPLEVLKQVDAKIELKAEQLLLPRLSLSDTTAHMVLKDGYLTVEPINCVQGGGTLDGRFELHLQGKTAAVAVALEIEQFDLGGMLEEMGINDLLQGNMDIKLDLKGRGNSIAGLMAGLNGKTIVVMSDGNINKKAIKLLGTDLSFGLLRLLNPFKKEEKYAKINCFVSGFDIKDGLAQSTALVMDTSQVSVVGYGKIDLKTEKINLSLKPSPKKGVGVKGLAKFSLSLGEFAKDFKFQGTLSKPSIAIDPTGSIFTLGKAIGGVALFGPFGIAAVLADGEFGDKNPCLAAIEAAKKGADDKKSEEKKGVIEKTTKDIGNGFKELLGR